MAKKIFAAIVLVTVLVIGDYACTDPPLVLMKYNGDSRADTLSQSGQMSDYAKNVLTLSEKLERLHRK